MKHNPEKFSITMWGLFFTMHPSQQNKIYNRFVGSILAMTLLIISLLVVFSFAAKAQITFVNFSTKTQASGSPIIIDIPAGVIANDVMIAHIAYDCTAGNISAPAGWTLIRKLDATNYLLTTTFYKVAGASEPANYSFSYAGGSLWSSAGGIVAYRGVDTGSPIDVQDGVVTPSSTSHSTPSVITTTADAMVLTFFGIDYTGSGPWTPPGAMTERYDINGVEEDLEAADVIQASAGATGAKTATCATAVKGTAQIIALREAVPMTYTSSTTTQSNVSSVGLSTTNNEIIGIQIVTSGGTSPLSATSFSLNTTGTTNAAADITNAKLWYTGTSSAFAATTQFGSTVLAPNGAFTFTGTQTLSSGTNYFWLTYDVPAGATVSNFIDGECTSLTVTTPRTPSVTAPGGNRQITNIVPPTFQCVSTATATGASLTITTPACVALNDVMIAHLAADASSGGSYTTVPAGWNLIRILNNTNYLYSVSYYKVATASEPANYTFTFSGASIWNQAGGILVYRGVDPCSPIDAEAGQLTLSSTSHSTPSITTTSSQDMIVSLFAIDYTGSGPWSPPAGMTERYDINGTDEDLEAADVVQASPGATGVKTATCATAVKGTAQIVALKPSSSPMSYSSSTTTQNNTSVVGKNTTNNDVIGIQIVTVGCSPPLDATSFSLNTTGTTAPATDITNAKIWYTGTNSAFAATTQFGTTTAAPNGAFTITGTQTLSLGTNYFWLSYDIPAGATANNFIDAECTSLTVGTPRTPSVAAPAGNRQISPLTPPAFKCVSTANSAAATITITKPGCVAVNDLMIAHLTFRSAAEIPLPAGWTQLSNLYGNAASAVFYKIATASEPADYTFSDGSGAPSQANVGAILVYSGVDITDPIESYGALSVIGTTTVHATSCITATTDMSMIVALFGIDWCVNCNLTDASFTAPAGMTPLYDIGKTGLSARGEAGYNVVQVNKGCVQKTATSVSVNNGIRTIMALRPSGAADAYSTVFLGGNTNADGSSSVTLTRPANTKQNDLILVHLTAAGTVTSGTATPPAGWTLIRFDMTTTSGMGSWLYYKVAGASEASNYTFSVAGSGGSSLMGAIRSYRGIDPAAPFQTSSGTATPMGSTQTAPSITTTSDSALVVTFYTVHGAGSYTPPANTTERYDYTWTSGHSKTISGDDFIRLSAGVTGIQTATTTANAYEGTAQMASFNRLTGLPSGECCGFLPQGPAPLPVEWLSFTAKLTEEKKVKLNWATASEMNNDYFTIERSFAPSPSGNGWGEVGIVKGAGNSSTISKYEFIDNLPPSPSVEGQGMRYYRIKQTDYDGKFDYSNIASVFIAPDGFYISELFPNPANDMTNVFVSSSDETTLSVMLYNNSPLVF